MYRNEEDEHGDNHIYTTYYNDVHNAEQSIDDLTDSDINSDDVDRLYSQIYHEICEDAEPLLSDIKNTVRSENLNSFLSKNLQSNVYHILDGKDNLTNQKSHIGLVDNDKNDFILRSTCKVDLSDSLIPRSDFLPVLSSKDIFCLDRTGKLKSDIKKKSYGKSPSWPDLKDMLLNRSVDNPDSDIDHVETVGIKRSRIKNKKNVNKLKIGSSACDQNIVKKKSNICDTKVDKIKLSHKLENSVNVRDCKRDKNQSDRPNRNIIEVDSIQTLAKGVSSSNKTECIVISSNSPYSSSSEKMKVKSLKKKKVGKVIVLGDSSSSDSESDSSNDDIRDASPACVIDSDSASLSNLELSDSTSNTSFNEDLEEMGSDIWFNINKSQQHLLDSEMDESSLAVDKKKGTLVWNICDRDRFGGAILNGRYYQPSTVRCRNCNEIGHLSKTCTKKKVESCILCGLGHFYRKCPNTLCYNCDAPGHDAGSCPSQRRHWYDLCDRCGMQGHLSANCPDIWRQYHMTTTDDLSVPNKVGKPNPRVFCYNCARPKHLGYECNAMRQNKYSAPSYPFVAFYGSFASNDSKTELANKKIKKSSKKREPSKKTVNLKRKPTVECLENASPRKKCKKSHKELPEANEADGKLLNGKDKKVKSNGALDKKKRMLKEKKRKKKKVCETNKVGEDSKEHAEHQLELELIQEKKRKKKEKKRLQNIQPNEKKQNAEVPPLFKTKPKNKNKYPKQQNHKYQPVLPKENLKHRGFSISKTVQNIVGR